jgi:hypothetical protein
MLRRCVRILAANGEAEGPPRSARLAPRAHTVFQRPRRGTTQPSRPAPAIVRGRPAWPKQVPHQAQRA